MQPDLFYYAEIVCEVIGLTEQGTHIALTTKVQ